MNEERDHRIADILRTPEGKKALADSIRDYMERQASSLASQYLPWWPASRYSVYVDEPLFEDIVP